MPSHILAVKIDRSLKLGRNLTSATSGYWRISVENAKNISTLVAISKQKVVGVFEVSHPLKISSGPNKGRVVFRLEKSLPKSSWAAYSCMGPFSFNSALKYL